MVCTRQSERAGSSDQLLLSNPSENTKLKWMCYNVSGSVTFILVGVIQLDYALKEFKIFSSPLRIPGLFGSPPFESYASILFPDIRKQS